MLVQSTLPDAGRVTRCCRCGLLKPSGDYFRTSQANPRPRAHCKACHYLSRGPWKRSRWHETAAGIRREGGRVLVADLRQSLGEPTQCYLCGDPLSWEDVSVDHVTPHSKGGSHDVTNLRWAHRECNRVKSDLTLDQLRALCRKMLGRLGG